MNFFVYVLLSEKDRKLYIGFSTDLKKRIDYHNNGYNKSTKNRRPLRLIYTEVYLDEEDAKKREKFFKTGHGREELKKILKNTLKKIKYAGIV